MALDGISKLSRDEQFQEAAKYAGVSADVLKGMWSVESAEGTNMLSSVGAEGHFQVMPKTRAVLEQRAGRTYDPYKFTDALEMAAEIMRENMVMSKGDVATALAMYHGGTDRRNWGPLTQSYPGKVLGKTDTEIPQPTYGDSVKRVDATADVFSMIDPKAAEDAEKGYAGGPHSPDMDIALGRKGAEYISDVEKGLIDAGRREGAIITGTPEGAQAGADAIRADVPGAVARLDAASAAAPNPADPSATRLGADTVQAEQPFIEAENLRNNRDFTDKFGAFFDSGLTAATMRTIASIGDEEQKAPEGWRYADHMGEYETPQDTYEERMALRSAGSPAEVANVRERIHRERYASRIISEMGTAEQIGWGLAAGFGDPMNVAAGVGVSLSMDALGVGVRAAVAAGRPVAAVARSAGEGVAGALLTDYGLMALGEHRSDSDFLTDAAFGLALGGATGLFQARSAQVQKLTNDVILFQAQQRAEALQAAEAELGVGTNPDVLARRANEIQVEREQRWREAALQNVPEEDRFFPRPDVEEVAPETVPNAGDTPRSTSVVEEGDLGPAPTQGDMVRKKIGDKVYAESAYLRKAVDQAAKTGSIRSLLKAVVDHAGLEPHYRALAHDLSSIAERLGVKVVPDPDPNATRAVGGIYNRGTNELYIRIARPDFILHETIHGITANALSLPKNLQTPQMAAAVTRMNTLFDHVREQLGTVDMDMFDTQLKAMLDSKGGPVSHPVELITYGMTDKNFQTFLASIPAPEGTNANSAWQWLKDLVSDFLGLTGDSRTALDELMDASGELIDHIRDNADTTVPLLQERVSVLGRGVKKSTAVEAPAAATALPDSLTAKQRKSVDAKYDLKNRISDDAERKLVAEVIYRAERMLSKNSVDSARLTTWLQKADLEATSTTMLNSESPVSRALAIMLLENPEGAAGRRATTAAIDRAQRFEQYMGNASRVMNSSYELWRQEQGIGKFTAMVNQAETRGRFNQALTEELLHRQTGRKVTMSPSIQAAADALDASYLRSLQDQRAVGSIGAQRLPEGGESGYFHRQWLGGKLRAMDMPQRQAFMAALQDQMMKAGGLYDETFVRDLSVEFLQRLERRAMRAANQEATLYSSDTADILRDSLKAMGLNEEEIAKNLNRFGRGGAGHTKGRIDLDMTALYDDGTGGKMRLMDFINQDQDQLLRQYASRSAGDVALSKYGIQGDAGIKIIRDALRVTDADDHTIRAFDQVMSEFLGRPVGTGDPTILTNARLLTGATRLGGLSFNQMGVYGDAIAVLGPARVMEAMGAIPRLRSEILDIVAGKTVDNPIISGLETMGADFGSSDYRIMGLGQIDEHAAMSGRESVGRVTQAIRAVSNGVRILSGHRMLIAVQTRGLAEQIVQKSWQYIRDGVEDAALADMGFSPALVKRLREIMPEVVEFDAAGKVKVFDPERATDRSFDTDLDAYKNAVIRGAGQLLQREFIGETGKWAHDGLLKFLFQFRTFSLVAHQKQLGRNIAVHGASRAALIVAGAASIAIPVHLARVALRASLLPDAEREEFLSTQLSPLVVGRQVMNYIAGLGLLPDMLDLGGGAAQGWATAAGADLPEWLKPTGGRAMSNASLLGGQFAPGIGLINDAAQAAAGNTKKLWRTLPGNTLPYITPFFMGAEAQLKDDE